MAYTQEQLQSYFSKKYGSTQSQTTGGGKLYSGGVFSDILDTVSIPSYAVGGLLSGNGIAYGVKNRIMPHEGLGMDTGGIKNKFLAFAVDVALDPLSYVGIGALTKVGAAAKLAKTGELGTTLWKQAALGQRSLLSLHVPFMKPLQGISLAPQALSTGVFGGFTKGTESIKQFGKAIGWDLGESFSTKFGTRNTLDLTRHGGGTALSNIEKAAAEVERGNKIIRQAGFKARGNSAVALAQVETITNSYMKAVKAGKHELKDVSRSVLRWMEDGVTELPDAIKPIANQMKQMSDELGVRWTNAGGSILEGKVLPNILKKDMLAETTGSTIAKGSRIVAGKNPSERFSTITEFKSGDGKLIGGVHKKGASKAVTLENGKSMIEMPDGNYVYHSVYKAIQNGKTTLPKQIKGLQDQLVELVRGGKANKAAVSDLTKKIDMLKKAQELVTYDNIKAMSPEMIFTRQAAGAERATEIAKKVGKEGVEFETDPTKLLGVKAIRTGKQEAKQFFVDGMKGIGVKAKKGAMPDGYAPSTHPELKGYAFPSEIVGHMDSTYTSFDGLKEVKKWVANFDAIQNLWKGSATYANIAFHTRNMISNLWQLHLAGVYDIGAYKDAMNIMWVKRSEAYAKGKSLYDVLEGAEKIRYSEFISQAVGGSGQFTVDFERTGELGAKVLAFMQKNPAFKLGGTIGGGIEDFAKFALFTQRRNAGMSVVDAADEVRKYLFDYADLTDFERNWMKRAFPFYTWTRKNIPLQAAMLIQKPGKFVDLSRFSQIIEENAEGKPIPDEYMPEWLREAYPVYFGTGDDGMKQYLKAEGFVPAVDLNKLARPWELPLDMLTPLIKTPGEIFTNYSVYTEREIKEFEGQKTRFAGVYMDPKVAYALSNFRPLSDLSKLFAGGDEKKIAEAKDRMLSFVLGKTYQFDQKTQKRTFEYLQSQQISSVKKAIEKAKSKGDQDEVARLKKYLKEVENGDHIHL